MDEEDTDNSLINKENNIKKTQKLISLNNVQNFIYLY